MSGDGPPRFVLGGKGSGDDPKKGEANVSPPLVDPDPVLETDPATEAAPIASYPPPSEAPVKPTATESPFDPPAVVPPASDLSSDGGISKAVLGGGALAVAAVLLVGGFLALRILGGGSGDVLVVEPRSNGLVDVHLAGFGEDLTNETEILDSVSLQGRFLEISDDDMATGSSVMDYESGQLIGYREDGDEDIVLALVDGDEVIELADGDGDLIVIRYGSGVFATFFESDQDRCTVFRLEGSDAERVARGDSCEPTRNGVLVADNGDVSFVNPDDLSETELGETSVSARVSNDNDLVVLSQFDPDSGDSGFEMVSVSNPSESEEYELDDDEFQVETMNNGVLVGTSTDSVMTGLSYVNAVDGRVGELLDGDAELRTALAPSGDRAFIFETDEFFEDEDVAVSLWVEGETQLRPIGELEGARIGYWLDSSTLIVVDWDGLIWRINPNGSIAQVGEFEDFDSDDFLVSNAQGIPGGRVVMAASPLADDRPQYVIVDGGGGVEALPEASNMDVFSDGDSTVLVMREDASDDEFLLAEFVDGETIEFDEADRFDNVFFDGGDVVYTARTGDDEDDIEVRRHSLGSSDNPTVEFDGASVYTSADDPQEIVITGGLFYLQ